MSDKIKLLENSSTKTEIEATLFSKIVFFAFGVSSSSGWNATLTAMDYF